MEQTTILSDDELQTIRAAGASPEFMTWLACADSGSLVKTKVKLAVRREDADPQRAVESYLNTAGSFAGSLADGELFSAFISADLTNSRALFEAFSAEYIIECGVAEGEPFDYCKRMVSDRERQLRN